MFAKALEANAPQCDHLVIPIHFVERFLQDYHRVLSVSDEGLFKSARHPCRSLDQTAAIRIVAAPSDDCPHGGFDLCPVGFAAMMESQDRLQRKKLELMTMFSSRQGAADADCCERDKLDGFRDERFRDYSAKPSRFITASVTLSQRRPANGNASISTGPICLSNWSRTSCRARCSRVFTVSSLIPRS